MQQQPNPSPFGWYLGTYIVGFNLADVDEQHDLHDEFDGWEVSVMVRADNCRQAFERIEQVALRDTRRYVGELDGITVDWEFKGVTEMDPMYKPVHENTDIVYVEHDRVKLKDQEYLVCDKHDYK